MSDDNPQPTWDENISFLDKRISELEQWIKNPDMGIDTRITKMEAQIDGAFHMENEDSLPALIYHNRDVLYELERKYNELEKSRTITGETITNLIDQVAELRNITEQQQIDIDGYKHRLNELKERFNYHNHLTSGGEKPRENDEKVYNCGECEHDGGGRCLKDKVIMNLEDLQFLIDGYDTEYSLSKTDNLERIKEEYNVE